MAATSLDDEPTREAGDTHGCAFRRRARRASHLTSSSVRVLLRHGGKLPVRAPHHREIDAQRGAGCGRRAACRPATARREQCPYGSARGVLAGHLVLHGRERERAELERLSASVRDGKSATLVLRGEAGIGKTALLDDVVERAAGCRIVRAVGIESEMELAFAALHQLCAPLMDGLERLPSPQRDALATVFGLSAGPPPDRFLVGLAALSLLADASASAPLIGVVDDAQWLDQSSAQALSFVARRLEAESVFLVFAERDRDQPAVLEGLPELRLSGLADADARDAPVLTDAARARRAAAGPDHRGGPREPPRPARVAARHAVDRARRRLRAAGRIGASGARRGQLPRPGRAAASSRRSCLLLVGRCRAAR